jgi:hypothetical protein
MSWLLIQYKKSRFGYRQMADRSMVSLSFNPQDHLGTLWSVWSRPRQINERADEVIFEWSLLRKGQLDDPASNNKPI